MHTMFGFCFFLEQGVIFQVCALVRVKDPLRHTPIQNLWEYPFGIENAHYLVRPWVSVDVVCSPQMPCKQHLKCYIDVLAEPWDK